MVGEAIRIICFTVIGLCMSLCGFVIGYGRKEIYANKQYLKGVEDGYKRRMMEENDKQHYILPF